MEPEKLAEISDERLIWECIEPVIAKVRGKDPDTKSSVFMHLNDGLRALFMFQTLYGHADQGISRFFLQISYMTDKLDIWAALKSSMKYFSDSEMLSLIMEMEKLYCSDLMLEENKILLDGLDRQYKTRLPETVRLIGYHIRNNPDVFKMKSSAEVRKEN